MKETEQYRRCLVLAGGGFRFAYYLGVHAAAEECGRRPDVLLATCGGALAAAVICSMPDKHERLNWMRSAAMYAFLRGIQATHRATILRSLAGVALRGLSRGAAPRLPDLSQDYLFELPEVLPLPGALSADAPALAIIGGRLLYHPSEAGSARGQRQLFAQVVFCPSRAAALLQGISAPAADARWSAGAVASVLELELAMPLAEAARISIADMVYFRSHAHGGQHYTGGVIDLFPIELAHQLAREVIMERKTPFNPWLALPALRAVLGIDGAARLRHVHAQHADAWVDTRDVSKVLRAHGIAKKIHWRRNRIGLQVPDTHAAYAAQVQAQWDYGYRKGLAAFAGAQS